MSGGGDSVRRGEILGLKWNQVDFIEGKITLAAGTTNYGEARTIFMPKEVFDILREQRLLRDEQHPECQHVFSNGGRPIRDFYTASRKATRNAGLPGKLFHDLRRTAVRNMVRKGHAEAVVMRVSGHKTRSVFDPYNIVNEADLKAVAQSMSASQFGESSKLHEELTIT